LLRGAELPAVHHRHVEIEHDDIGAELVQPGQAILAVRGGDDVITVRGEQLFRKALNVGVVVHDQNHGPLGVNRHLVRENTMAAPPGT
jgi:hypothetical protein